MTIFDKSEVIQAPVHLVWQEAYKLARKGRIEVEEINMILFATHLKFGYVYLLKEQEDGMTVLRHVIDTSNKVKEGLDNNPDPWIALDNLASITDTPARENLGTAKKIIQMVLALVGLGEATDFPSLKEMGEGQFSQIRKRAERAAKSA